jgi:hypothetical protein
MASEDEGPVSRRAFSFEAISLGGRQHLHDLPQTWRVIKGALTALGRAVSSFRLLKQPQDCLACL